ncbi:translocator [Nesidiocoris tenuis]|uniref:Translocator n=2 Tax=Nesidiocoris tenuis TaxID=355587 RepID=A0ABN7AYC5_9HEMI|nr:translocator [Nesidiocoris tenuis]
MPLPIGAIGASVLPNVGGWVGGLAVMGSYAGWYKNLKKPSWTPPRAAFGPVWTTLYTSMGYASYLVWRDGGGFEGALTPLAAYGTQLALNWAWTPIFFGCHSLKWGLVDITLLTVAAGTTAALFYQVNQTAGLLMVPYLGWLGIATSLNYWIYVNNREESEKKD